MSVLDWFRAPPDLLPRSARMRIDSVGDHPNLERRGIYFLYADRRARAVLSAAGLRVRSDGLVYSGKATVTFRQRVVSDHINGTRDKSGVRATLRGILGKSWSPARREDVDRFMRAHFTVALQPVRWGRIGSVEKQFINEYRPCFNLKDNPCSHNPDRVRELRERGKDPHGLLSRLWRSVWRR